MKFFKPNVMGTPVTSGSSDLGTGVHASPMGPGGSSLISEGQRSSDPTILGSLGYLGPFLKFRRPLP